ncbi:MAG: ester cyclase [Bacteroidetes bacterium]|nr:ester cyclase [Bacteroidota bacterium]
MKNLSNKRFVSIFSALIITIIFIAGCQQQTDYSKELKSLVDKYNSVWETGNVDELDAIFDPNFVRHADASTSAEGLDALKKMIKDFHTAYSDKKLVSEEEIYTKDKFVGRWTFTATNTGPGEMAPTGKTIKIWGINIIHFENGKIVEEWDGYDNQTFMEQLGFTMVSPSGSGE